MTSEKGIKLIEKSNKATVLLQLLKETIGIDTPIEMTTWHEISKKFGELMEETNKELGRTKTETKTNGTRNTSTKTSSRSRKSVGKAKTIN